jgi:hypothetical protein
VQPPSTLTCELLSLGDFDRVIDDLEDQMNSVNYLFDALLDGNSCNLPITP